MKKLITFLICIAVSNIMMFAQNISKPVSLVQSDKYINNIPSSYDLGMELFNKYKTSNLKKSKSAYQPATVKLYYTTSKIDSILFTFDANGNKLTELHYTWKNNDWVNSSRFTYTYDVNGNFKSMFYEYWPSNAWVGLMRMTADYNGNTLTYLFEQFQGNAWVNTQRQTYNVDGNQVLQNMITELWQSNVWVNSERYSYTYDAKGKQLTDLHEKWTNNAWVNYYRYTNTWDANGNMLTRINELWQTDTWVNSYTDTYTYDAKGNILTDIYATWVTNSWANSNRITYTYDVNGNRIVYLKEQWLSSAWVNSYKHTYAYDANGNGTITDSYNWVTGNWANNTTTNYNLFIYYNNSAHNFYNASGYKMIATYEISTGISKPVMLSNCTLTNYPNPFSNSTTISYNLSSARNVNISVYDISGKEVTTLVNQAQQKGEYNIQFNASNLQSGIYFYKIITGNKSETGKMILVNAK